MQTGTTINRTAVKNDSWATPPAFYNALNEEFAFDFDPCSLKEGEITPENDGLLKEWGKRNFVNPPYRSQKKNAFIIKAVEESKKGKLVVMLLPCMGFSTRIFHDIILPNLSQPIRLVRGRLKFIGRNTKGEMVDNMLVIFGKHT